MNVVVITLLLFTVSSGLVSIVEAESVTKKGKGKNKYKQPNIIFLLTDDQDELLTGTTNMPYLQKHLAAQGTYFRNYFVHTPICCSSRSTTFTGRYIHNGGATGNGAIPGNCDGPNWRANNEKHTFAVHAKQAGYRTSFAGKYLNAMAGRPIVAVRFLQAGSGGWVL